MKQLEKCSICHTVSPKKFMIQCHDMGNITYECMDLENCKKMKLKLKRKEEVELEELELSDQLSKEEKLLQLYGISIKDLIQYHHTFRNCSEYYYDSQNNVVYSWLENKKKWEKANKDMTRKVIMDLLLG